MDNLEPCPFCKSPNVEMVGNEHAGLRESRTFFAVCIGCLAEGPVKLSLAEAIEAWNRRTPSDASQADSKSGDA